MVLNSCGLPRHGCSKKEAFRLHEFSFDFLFKDKADLRFDSTATALRTDHQ